MRIYRAPCTLLTLFTLLTCLSLPVQAQSIEELVRQSQALSAQQRHDEAVQLLQARERTSANDLMLKLAIARALAWSGRLEEGTQRLQRMLPDERANADVMLLEADLAYYRGQPDQAIKTYQAILTKVPDYVDAQQGLQRAMAARQAANTPERQEAVLRPQWQVAMGSEYSRFDQEGRAPWRAHFLQFDHLREGVSPYVRLTRHDQYQLLDTEYEAGVNWSGAPRWTLVAGAAFTDSPNFRPRHHLYADSDIVVASGAPQSWTLWATLQLRHDTYSDGARVNTLNPGLAWSPLPPIKLSVNMIAVDKTDAPRVHGRAMRVDHTLSEEFSWFVGYADAPEAELGRVVRTKTWFTGVTLDLNSRYTVRLGYTHDDRVDTYVRQMVNASVAYRF